MSTSIYPVPNAVIPATTTVQGIVQLAGDLGGTASSPTVVSVADVTAGTLAVINGGTGVTTSTGSGAVVLSASPTFTGTVSGASATWTGEDKASDFKATGLPGATAASRYAGATASGAPTTGTFAVGDYVVDQTGKIYVCTVAGTPGTWVQVGATTTSVTMGGDVTGNSATSTVAKINGTALATLSGATSGQVLAWNGSAWAPATSSGGAPGTTVESFITSNVSNIGTAPVNITSISLTAGTWLINYQAVMLGSSSSNYGEVWLTTTSASTTNAFTGISYFIPASSTVAGGVSGSYSYTVSSTTTIYFCTQGSTLTGIVEFQSGNAAVIPNVTGITAVRTA